MHSTFTMLTGTPAIMILSYFLSILLTFITFIILIFLKILNLPCIDIFWYENASAPAIIPTSTTELILFLHNENTSDITSTIAITIKDIIIYLIKRYVITLIG